MISKLLKFSAKFLAATFVLLLLLIVAAPYWISSTHGNQWLSQKIEEQIQNSIGMKGTLSLHNFSFAWNGTIQLDKALYENEELSMEIQKVEAFLPIYEVIFQPHRLFNLIKKERAVRNSSSYTYLVSLPNSFSLTIGSCDTQIKNASATRATLSLHTSLPQHGTEITALCKGTAYSAGKEGSFLIDSSIAGLEKNRTIAIYRNSAGLFQFPREQKIACNIDIDNLPLDLLPNIAKTYAPLIGGNFSGKAQLNAAHEQINLHAQGITPLAEFNCGLSTVDHQVLLTDTTEFKLKLTPTSLPLLLGNDLITLKKDGNLLFIVEQFLLPFEDGTANFGNLLLNARCSLSDVVGWDSAKQETISFDEFRCGIKTPHLAEQLSIQLKSKINYGKKSCSVDLSSRLQNLLASEHSKENSRENSRDSSSNLSLNIENAKSDTTLSIDNLPLYWIDRFLPVEHSLTALFGPSLSCNIDFTSEGRFSQGRSSIHTAALNVDNLSFSTNAQSGLISTPTPIYYSPPSNLLTLLLNEPLQIQFDEPLELQIKKLQIPLDNDYQNLLKPTILQECQVDSAIYLSKGYLTNSPFAGTLQRVAIKIQQNESSASPLYCEASTTYLPKDPFLQLSLGKKNQCKFTLTTPSTEKAHQRYQLHLQADSELLQAQGTVGYDLQKKKIRFINPVTCSYQFQPYLFLTLLQDKSSSAKPQIEMLQPAQVDFTISPIEYSLEKNAFLSDLHADCQITNCTFLSSTFKEPLIFSKCTFNLTADPKKQKIDLETAIQLISNNTAKKAFWNLSVEDFPLQINPNLANTSFTSSLQIEPFPVASLLPFLPPNSLKLCNALIGSSAQISLLSQGKVMDRSEHVLDIVGESFHATTHLELSPQGIKLLPHQNSNILLTVTPNSFAELQQLSAAQVQIVLVKPISLNLEIEQLSLPLDKEKKPQLHLLECTSTLSMDQMNCASSSQPNDLIDLKNFIFKITIPHLFERCTANGSFLIERTSSTRTEKAPSTIIIDIANPIDASNKFQIQNAATKIQVDLRQVPSSLLAPLISNNELDSKIVQEAIGDSLSLHVDADLLQLQGGMNVFLQSANLNAQMQGVVQQGILRLSKDSTTTWKPTKNFCYLISQRIGPDKLQFDAVPSPVTLTIPINGTTLPLYPYVPEQLNLGESTFFIDKIRFHRTPALQKLFSTLNVQSKETITLWPTPLYISGRSGIITLDRWDFLLGGALHALVWGNANLPQNQINLTIGITGETLSQLKKIALPENYVFEVPIGGRLTSPSVDWPLAATRYGALELSRFSRSAGMLGMAFDLMTKKGQASQAPQPRQAFPWIAHPDEPEILFPKDPTPPNSQPNNNSDSQQPNDSNPTNPLEKQLLRFSKSLFGG